MKRSPSFSSSQEGRQVLRRNVADHPMSLQLWLLSRTSEKKLVVTEWCSKPTLSPRLSLSLILISCGLLLGLNISFFILLPIPLRCPSCGFHLVVVQIGLSTPATQVYFKRWTASSLYPPISQSVIRSSSSFSSTAATSEHMGSLAEMGSPGHGALPGSVQDLQSSSLDHPSIPQTSPSDGSRLSDS